MRSRLWIALVGAALLLGAAFLFRGHTPSDLPAARAAVDRAQQRVAHADTLVRRADTVLVRDTVRVTRAVAGYAASRARVDTVLVTGHGDSVRVDTVTVVRDLVAQADSMRRACTAVVSSCAARIAAADSARAADHVLAQAEIRRALAQGEARGRLRGTLRGVLEGAAVGLLAGALLHR